MPDKKRTATGVLGGLAGLAGLSAVAGVLVTATVTPAIAVSGVAASSAISIFDNMPSVLEIDKLMLPTEIYRHDPDTGTDVLFTRFYEQDRSPVAFDQIAPVMYDAILSSEDPRYYQHGGVDLIGTTRALLSNAQGGPTQGGSSISQQYVKNVLIQRCEKDAEAEYDDDGNETRSVDEVRQSCFLEATQSSGIDGYERKLQEMRYAIQLEKQYSKNEILLGYLNIANFGGTTYSVDAAAKYYFNVPASQLSVAQAATLAGIVQNPNTYRIDKTDGSIIDDGVTFNKAPDGAIDDVTPGTLAALDTKLDAGEITQEQYLAAADGYSATKSRQLYVLSRMLDDGKITQEQYDAAVLEPITPTITPSQTGCASTGGAAYFCQYVVKTILNDPAFGETPLDRERALRRDGLKIYTTMDPRVQITAQDTMAELTPTSVDGMRFGSTVASVEAGTGRVLAIAQNTRFSEDQSVAADPNYSSLVYAGNNQFGNSNGFPAGSTFKLFTLIDWLEKGHSVNETLNGRVRVIPRMTNSCEGDWINQSKTRVGNFGGGGGYTGTPMQFTRDSLNSGFFAMAEELDLCDIGKVATKMGMTTANDLQPIKMNSQFSVIGSANVSPLDMAGAYATVASGGIYCQPKIIDRVTDNEGNDRPDLVPVRTCNQVLTPEVAATAAYALQGVMNSGGTGSLGNPRDGTPLIGKTGTHETFQTWLIESSTKVATAAWVGNSEGEGNVFQRYHNGTQLSNLRYAIARSVQARADEVYGGDAFPQPDNTLTRRVLKDVPSVVGQTIEQAQATLRDAGWESTVGEPVDSDQPTNVIVQQDPSGQAPSGTWITIRPSNGQSTVVPPVGGSLEQAAATLTAAGFSNLTMGTCTPDPDGQGNQRTATGTNPAAGSVVSRSTAVQIDYTSRNCP